MRPAGYRYATTNGLMELLAESPQKKVKQYTSNQFYPNTLLKMGGLPTHLVRALYFCYSNIE